MTVVGNVNVSCDVSARCNGLDGVVTVKFLLSEDAIDLGYESRSQLVRSGSVDDDRAVLTSNVDVEDLDRIGKESRTR